MTVATFFPILDGYIVGRSGGGIGSDWSVIRGLADGFEANDSSSICLGYIQNGSGTNKWKEFGRIVFLFDTSSLPDGITIAEASLFVTGQSKIVDFSGSFGLVASTPASDSALVTEDYDEFGTARFASDILLSTFDVSKTVATALALNAAGIAAISLTGITKFGVRIATDIDNAEPGWISNNSLDRVVLFTSEESEPADQRPFLRVTHPGSVITEFGLRAQKKAMLAGIL